NSPRFVSQKAIEYIIDDTLEKTGVRKPGLIHLSHGFRKFFVSQCESTPMKSVHVSLLSGHDIGVKKHYYITKESVVLEDYMTHAADALTIDPTKRLQQRVNDLENDQAQEIARLKWREGQQAQEIDELKTQLQDVQLQTNGNKSHEAEVLTRLREKDDALVTLSDQVVKLMSEVQELKNQRE
ncbi:MAG TPA: hypothetical protein VE130_11960, partial [Nitrososphaeraceae archaeon]|nr:hypothetical protein [Nitrososphaeraceae archaeon]